MKQAALKGSILAAIGYLLSPLSWWNDVFINLPIAYGIGLLAGLIDERLFLPTMVTGYWLTNVTGLILLHHGLVTVATGGGHNYSKGTLIKDILVSVAYTLVIVALASLGILRFPTRFF